MSEFKCRSSCVGHIVTDGKGTFLTGKQSKELERLLALKAIKESEGNDVTAKQNQTIIDFISRRDAKPQLSESAKSYLKEWFINDLYGRRKELSSKFTEKGLTQEEEGIELFSRVSGREFIMKNEEYKENDWITGTCDVNTDAIIDIKCSWDLFTFPMFDSEIKNKLYWWQLQAYMWLYGKQEAELAYCLVDTPLDLILKEINSKKWDVTCLMTAKNESEFEDEITKNMTFGDIPEAQRVKIFKVSRDEKAIEKIKERVIMCREYIKELKLIIK